MSTASHQRIWYLAAGYKLPAGIEAYLLHYATELRKHGFITRIIVFEPLPVTPHRFLVALRARGIPIESLFQSIAFAAWMMTVVTYLPWRARTAKPVISRWVDRLFGKECPWCDSLTTQQPDNSTTLSSLHAYWLKRLAVRLLKRMIGREHPDIIHVKGRIIAEAFPILPSDRTIYQHALMGTRDPSWTDSEADAFSVFLNRIAAVLVQGKRIAETFAQHFNITRPIDVVYTMAPDEAGGGILDARSRMQDSSSCASSSLSVIQHPASDIQHLASSLQNPSSLLTSHVSRPLRFGILCRFTEQKGIIYILEALRMYKEKHGAVNFTFAGQGPMEGVIQGARSKILDDVVEERSTLSGIQHPVSSIPYSASNIRIIPVDSAVNVLKNLDVFVHPGLDDAMPVSIVEALMCGVPCIVSDVGASPELVRDGIEGLVVPPASAEVIFRAMSQFAAMNSDELCEFRERARRRYEEVCTPAVVGAQVAGIYKSIMVERVSYGRHETTVAHKMD